MRHARRYIFRQLLWWTLFVTTCLCCVLWLTQSLRFVELIINRGLSVVMFLYMTMLLLPTFLMLVLPIALFTATMFTYNKMITDNELVVLRATGVSPLGLARPALSLAAILVVIGYGLTVYFVPASYREFKRLQFEFRNSYGTVMLQEGVFNQLMSGITVFVRDRTPDGELLGIIVHDSRNPAKPVTMMAERGAIVPGSNGPRVVMVKGNRQEVSDESGRLSLLYFDRYTFDVGGLVESQHERWRDPRERYLHELLFPWYRSGEIWNFQKLRMEGLHRLVAPWMAPVFVLVGLAFLLGGEFNRRGQHRRIIAGVLAIAAIEAAVLGTKSLGERMPGMAPLMHLSLMAPMAAAAYVLVRGMPRLRRRQRLVPAA